MNEKAVRAIQHVTTATLADDSETAVMELDNAGELIDELVQEHQDGAKGKEEKNDVEQEQPDDDEPQDEDGDVRAKMGEKVRTLKESVPTPHTPLALAGIGVIAALAGLGTMKALGGRGEE